MQNFNFKTSYVTTKHFNPVIISSACCIVISKHPMLLPNYARRWFLEEYNLYFKTSYVTTKPFFVNISINFSLFQNILCYYQTSLTNLPDRLYHYFKTSYVTTKHLSKSRSICSASFQNILCYYQTNGFKPFLGSSISAKPLNRGILFKFYQPTLNFHNDS